MKCGNCGHDITRCAFDHCKKEANPGCSGYVELDKAKISFSLCLWHWIAVGKIEEEQEAKKCRLAQEKEKK